MRILLTTTAVLGLTVAGCTNTVDDEGNVMGANLAGTGDEQALTSHCASGPTVKGIDVSYYQGSIDWKRVANDGVKYAFVRVSDGTGFHDSKFAANWAGAKEHGILRGAYQFFEPGEDAVQQADLLIEKVGGHVGEDDLPPVLDVEVTGGQSAHTIATKAKAWMNRIKDKLHVNGIVYTGPYFWADSVGGADLNDHPLWVAHYGTQCPLVPPTWTHWTLHQFTSSAGIAGISGGVDEDHFNGTLAELKDMAGPPGPTEPHACVTHHFRGAFCDDDGMGAEPYDNQLKNELGVDFHCGKKAGSPAFCPDEQATRSQAAFVLGAAAKIPLNGHPDAFHDDNNDAHEKYLNAAKAFGILVGSNGKVNPDGLADRNQLATMLYRMYALPDVQHDYFYDDDGDADEHVHNAIAAAGLMVGFDDAHHTRNAFKGTEKATRSTLATVAVRAHDLVPVWNIPGPCKSGNFSGAFCDDDQTTVDDEDTRLKRDLGVDFTCGKLAGSPAFCPGREVTRAESMFVFGAAAKIPLAGHPDAFKDDDNNRYEKYLDAAKAFGVMNGWSGGVVKPNAIATRNTLAVLLARIYQLPPATTDYFSDDDGDADEDIHNRVAAAGLFAGFDDGHGGRKFEGDKAGTRAMLSTLAVRAADNGLRASWAP